MLPTVNVIEVGCLITESRFAECAVKVWSCAFDAGRKICEALLCNELEFLAVPSSSIGSFHLGEAG